MVDDALDGCDALLVKQLRTERDSAYRARDDAAEAKNAAEATAQRLAADEAAKAAQEARSECEAASAAALEKATAASTSALAACEASSAAELEKVTAASAAALKQATDAHAAATKDASAQHAAALETLTTDHAAALKEATDQIASLKREQASLIDEHDKALTAKDEYYVAAHSGALAAKDEQHRETVASVEQLLNSKHEAVRSSLERRLKEDTEALAKRHAEELGRAEAATTEAVNAAIKSQNEKHAQVIEAELKRQESDFLVWHGDELRRRRPHNRLKKLVGSIRKGNAAKDQKTLSFRRTEEGAEPTVEVSQESPPSEPKKKGLFRRISKKSKE